ncbi:MAG: hypothetical protein HY553_06315 [Elusimicrobia bacterium]|nr:hypothetical protein [Elusimicrobiota bacterium]
MELRVRRAEAREETSPLATLALAAAFALSFAFAVRAARAPRDTGEPLRFTTDSAGASESLPPPQPPQPHEPPLPEPPAAPVDAGLPTDSEDAQAREDTRSAQGPEEARELLVTSLPADERSESSSYARLHAGAPQAAQGIPSARFDEVREAEPRARRVVGTRVVAAPPAPARTRRRAFYASSRYVTAPPAAAPLVSGVWPTFEELADSIFRDAATLAATAPPIAADPAASYAMGGETGLAAGGSANAASGSGAAQGSSDRAGPPGGLSRGGGAGAASSSSGGPIPAAPKAPAGPAPGPVVAPLPLPAPSHIPWRAAQDATGMAFPDISIWRVPHDWDALDRASHGIVVMKVRQAGVDRAFNKSLDEAEKRKMIVIGYAFGYGIDGAAQADALLLNFPPKPGRILMLDLEHNPYGSSMTERQAIDFVERIRARTGSYPMLYTSASRARPGALAKCPRYVAKWSDGAPASEIWQFTNGVVGPTPHSFPGVGSCDINRLKMSYGALRRMAGLDRDVARR